MQQLQACFKYVFILQLYMRASVIRRRSKNLGMKKFISNHKNKEWRQDMKDITRNRWKKVGYFSLSWVPMLLYGTILMGVSIIGAIFIGVKSILSGEMDIYNSIMDGITQGSMLMGVIYAILGIIATGLWYYFGCKRKNLKFPKEKVSFKLVLGVAGLAFTLQYVVNYFMTFIGILFPERMENYIKLMELAGLDKITVAAILYGVILGPIAEELTFRGLTLYFTEKCTKRFGIANTLQAFAFGIFHMNLIQGVYAFFLGLVMGFLYRKYRSLYVTIIFHIFFNFLGFTMTYIDALLPQNIVFRVIWGILMCVAALILWVRIDKKELVAEENGVEEWQE